MINRGVGVLLVMGVVVVLEPHRLGDPTDVRLVAQEEMPPLGRFRATVLGQDGEALGGGLLHRLAGVEAQRDGVVLLADGPADVLERLDGLAEHHAADGGAGVVREREDDRALSVEERSEADRLPRLVLELRVHWRGAVEMLHDADILEARRHDGCPLIAATPT
jgi:hypothetical protein